MARRQRKVTLAEFKAVVKKYESGVTKHVQIAEATGVDPNVAWEIGAAAGFRKNGEAQREAYQEKVSTYLERGGEPEKNRTPWVAYEPPAPKKPTRKPRAKKEVAAE
jgi:hypothetical protein